MSGDQLDLDEITERCERAVDGPWTPSLSITGWAVVVGEGPAWVADTIDEAAADFIACASEDVPALVDEVRRLRAGVESANESWRLAAESSRAWKAEAERLQANAAQVLQNIDAMDPILRGVTSDAMTDALHTAVRHLRP